MRGRDVNRFLVDAAASGRNGAPCFGRGRLRTQGIVEELLVLVVVMVPVNVVVTLVLVLVDGAGTQTDGVLLEQMAFGT